MNYELRITRAYRSFSEGENSFSYVESGIMNYETCAELDSECVQIRCFNIKELRFFH